LGTPASNLLYNNKKLNLTLQRINQNSSGATKYRLEMNRTSSLSVGYGFIFPNLTSASLPATGASETYNEHMATLLTYAKKMMPSSIVIRLGAAKWMQIRATAMVEVVAISAYPVEVISVAVNVSGRTLAIFVKRAD
jgi:hypothetical protein